MVNVTTTATATAIANNYTAIYVVKWKTLTVMYQSKNYTIIFIICSAEDLMYIISLTGYKIENIVKYKLVERKQGILLLVFVELNSRMI